jgi:hypothetical protein
MSNCEWLRLYQLAETEQDISKLEKCATDAECAIFVRMRELRPIANSTADIQREFQALRSAAYGLLQIRTQRLKWPGFESNAPKDQSVP